MIGSLFVSIMFGVLLGASVGWFLFSTVLGAIGLGSGVTGAIFGALISGQR